MPSPLRVFLAALAEKKAVVQQKLDDLRRLRKNEAARNESQTRLPPVAPAAARQFQTGSARESENSVCSGVFTDAHPKKWTVWNTKLATGHADVNNVRALRRPRQQQLGTSHSQSFAATTSGGDDADAYSSSDSPPLSLLLPDGSVHLDEQNASVDDSLIDCTVSEDADSSSLRSASTSRDLRMPSLPPAVASGWDTRAVSLTNFARVLLSPKQQCIALKIMLHEAMTYNWVWESQHAQWCPRPPPAAATAALRDEESGAMHATYDADAHYFSFVCSWKTLLGDIFDFVLPHVDAAGIATSEATGVWADVLKTTVQTLHTLELFQRASSLQGDVRTMQRLWNEYSIAYNSYVQAVIEQQQQAAAMHHYYHQHLPQLVASAEDCRQEGTVSAVDAGVALHVGADSPQRAGSDALFVASEDSPCCSSVGYRPRTSSSFLQMESPLNNDSMTTAPLTCQAKGTGSSVPSAVPSLQYFALQPSELGDPRHPQHTTPSLVFLAPVPPHPPKAPDFNDVPSYQAASKQQRLHRKQRVQVTAGDSLIVSGAPSTFSSCDAEHRLPLNWALARSSKTRSTVAVARRKSRLQVQILANSLFGY